MKRLAVLLALLLAPLAAVAQTTPVTTVPSIAALKTVNKGISAAPLVNVVDANPGSFTWSTTPCSAADDIFQVTPTSGPTGCYTRMATPYYVGKSATTNGVLVTNGSGVSSISSTLPAVDGSAVLVTPTGASAAPSVATQLGYVRYAQTYGAVCNGGPDDATAINAALSAGAGVVRVANGSTCRAASTITIPGGVTLDMGNFQPGNPLTGSRIVCDAAVTPCVQLTGGGNNGTASLRNATVTRVAGTPASTVVGIFINNGYNVTLENVISDNHGICISAKTNTTLGTGIGARIINGYTSRCVDAHVDIDSWPELYWIGGRLGQNGSTDYASQTIVRVHGGTSGTAGGPNTVVFDGVQFNASGIARYTHFWEFVNLGAGGVPGIDATDFKIANSHIEGISNTGAIFYSDSTWNAIDRFTISNTTINAPTVPMWDLDAATTPSNWHFSSDIFLVSTFNLAPTNGFTSVSFDGSYVYGTMSLTGTAGSTVSINGLQHGNNFTLAGTWGAFNSIGETFASGSFTNSATGNIIRVAANGPNLISPAITFAGANSFTTTQTFAVADSTKAILIAGATKGMRLLPTASGALIEGTDNTGSASFQPLTLGGSTVSLSISGSAKWNVGTTGSLLANTDNSYDIGASGATRPRDLFLGRNLVVGGALTYGGVTLTNAVTGTGSMVLSASPTFTGTVNASALTTSGVITAGAQIVTKNYTVATLPAAPGQGARAHVTDATACTFLGALTGGGSAFCPVVYDGTAWKGG